jgi:hypothetical protein
MPDFCFLCVDISVQVMCSGGTPNSRSFGTVWFADILSVYCRSSLPNESGVRDWNWPFRVDGILIDIFILADEMFLEQRRYFCPQLVITRLTLTMITGKAWSGSSVL